MLELVQQIYKNSGFDLNLSPDDMSFAFENESIKVKFVIQNLYAYEDAVNGGLKLESMEFYVLTDLKK